MNAGKIQIEEQIFNRNYKSDLSFNIRFNFWMLRLVGSWPRPVYHPRLKTIENAFLQLLCYVLLGCSLIPGSVGIVFEQKDLYMQFKLGSTLGFILMAVLKYYFLNHHEDDIRWCTEYIDNDWKNVKHYEDRKIMLDSASFCHRLILICGFFSYGSVIFFCIILPLTQGRIVEEGGNLTYIMPSIYFPMTILDFRHSPYNEIICMVQLLSSFVCNSITVTACALAALLAMHACGQIQVLMSWMENLVDGREKNIDSLDQRLANIVELHVRIVNFIARTDNLLREISLIEFVGCTIIMCFVGYYTMMEWSFTQPVSGLTWIIVLISITFNIFIFCYIGELLVQETIKISEKSYMIEWYRMPGKTQLAIPLIISMSRSTMKITAGNIIELSVSSFADVSIAVDVHKLKINQACPNCCFKDGSALADFRAG
ncbi:uncharacterized protein LOC108628421 isoform X2 [Ceratina calcarata]|uniref:Odorant receptor n=1 Tax=Ceratina calcarata TaxID=156304 RepID=A0AAJ7NAK4_9HYME|nr:uncharacterized protein LOC108628421 isoform X2 [Ceratina calcarata]